ncbi:MAG: ferredoxin [Deltaproteobacteria bacterium CG1_02_45_11]|nr:MAG: ferredoxin [Deltaproteobacteria bacterium CG1_02_45_11]
MKIPVVELSECVLCGVCAEVAPSVFRMNDSGYVEIFDLTSYPESEVDEAIKNCPADCIAWEKT